MRDCLNGIGRCNSLQLVCEGVCQMIYMILIGLTSIIMAAFLELNRNTLFGWALWIALLAIFIILNSKGFFHDAWWKKAVKLFAYIGIFVLIAAVSWPPLQKVKAYDTKEVIRTETVKTEYGDVRGVVLEGEKSELFAGIPYAAPPVGELRWKKPQDAESWEGIRECDEFAPMSMQSRNLPVIDSLTQIIGYHDYEIRLDDQYREAVSEDSLYLNIWRPHGECEKLPVIVYIHGGSLQTGQPWYADYSGQGFAEKGAICVNMGYRLGVFGFLALDELAEEDADHTTGNYGLLDQIKALEWVRDNIAAFGGDPENVTLIGESAGAVCVDALCVSPLAEGLFERAVMESSTISSPEPPHSYRLYDEALSSGKDLMERYGCSSVEELRSLDAEKLVNEQATQHHVTIDGYVLPDTPYSLRKNGVHNEKALLHGFNAEESGPFILFSKASLKNYEQKVRAFFNEYADEVLVLYPAETDEEADQAWAEIYGAVFFNYSHHALNRLENENNVPVWQYLFTKSNGRLGCWHSGEMVYAFHNIPDKSKLYDEDDRKLSDLMNEYWISFAKTGNPNSGSESGFETSDSERIMEFGNVNGMIDEPYLKLYEIIDRMQGVK